MNILRTLRGVSGAVFHDVTLIGGFPTCGTVVDKLAVRAAGPGETLGPPCKGAGGRIAAWVSTLLIGCVCVCACVECVIVLGGRRGGGEEGGRRGGGEEGRRGGGEEGRRGGGEEGRRRGRGGGRRGKGGGGEKGNQYLHLVPSSSLSQEPKTGDCVSLSFHQLATADLRSSAVTDFISLSDPITTDRVPYGHGGLVGETAAEIVGGQSFLEIRSATVTPLGGRRTPGDGGHDAVT